MTPHGDSLIRKSAKIRLVRYKLSLKQVNLTSQILLSEEGRKVKKQACAYPQIWTGNLDLKKKGNLKLDISFYNLLMFSI